MANGTGGVTAPTSYGGANTNQGSRDHKPKTRRRNGVVEYRWPNGSWHSRRFGAKYRSNHSNGGGDGNNGTGGTPAPNAPSKHPYLDMARNDARLAYGGIESSLNQRGLAIPSWFQNYRDQVSQQQALQQAYAKPLQAQAQAQQQQAGQVAPGVDPNSQAGQEAQQAAQARSALQGLGLTTLNSILAANQGYLTGRQTVASTAEVGAQTDLARERSDVAKEKGSYIQSQRAKHKDEARQQQLENAAFGLKASDAANKLNKYGYTTDEWNSFSPAKKNRIRNRSSQGTKPDMGKVNKYGYTEKEWRAMSTSRRQQIINSFDQSGGKGGHGFTPVQRQKTKVQVRKGLAAIKRSLEGKSSAPVGFWGKAYNDLLDGGYDPLLARAVIQIARFGKAKAGVARRVRRNYGIGLPTGKAVHVPPPYEHVGPTDTPGAPPTLPRDQQPG